jgi:acetoin utilization protein AcuB
MKRITVIKDFMTTAPITIPTTASLEEARRVMREHRIRHLPVVNARRLVGILSDRDIKSAAYHLAEDFAFCRVEDAMEPNPIAVTPDTSLMTAVKLMADRKVGSVIVTGPNERIEGIFTAIDAMRVFASVFNDEQVSEAMAPGFYSSFGIES